MKLLSAFLLILASCDVSIILLGPLERPLASFVVLALDDNHLRGPRAISVVDQGISTNIADIDGADDKRRLGPAAGLKVTIAGIVVTGAALGVDLMELANSKPLKSLIVAVDSDETKFHLSIVGGAVNHDATIMLTGRGKGVSAGETVDCWDYKLNLVIQEPIADKDCHRYMGHIKHMCAPHDDDKKNGPSLSINTYLCTDSKAGGGITSWKDGENTWFKKGIVKPKNKECKVHTKKNGHKDCITDGKLEIEVDYDYWNEIVGHNFDVTAEHTGQQQRPPQAPGQPPQQQPPTTTTTTSATMGVTTSATTSSQSGQRPEQPPDQPPEQQLEQPQPEQPQPEQPPDQPAEQQPEQPQPAEQQPEQQPGEVGSQSVWMHLQQMPPGNAEITPSEGEENIFDHDERDVYNDP